MSLTSEFLNIATYITRTDNAFIYYQEYAKGGTPLSLLINVPIENIENLLNSNCSEKIITSIELEGIILKLIELQQSGIQVVSTRIPLLEQKFKFKGYRRVEFKYEDTQGVHTLTITHKRKEIILEVKVNTFYNR